MQRRRIFFLPFVCSFVALFGIVAAGDRQGGPHKSFGGNNPHMPSGWQGTTIEASPDDLRQIAQDALQPLANGTNALGAGLDVSQFADLVAAFAEFDHHSQSTVFQGTAVSGLQNFQASHPTFTTSNSNNEIARWGLAAYHLFRAYGNLEHLNVAKTIWTQLNTSFVTATDAEQGFLSTISGGSRFNPVCNNTSVQGAVLQTPTGSLVDPATLGPFIILSSHLYQATKNATYSNAAAQSIEFFKAFLTSDATVHDAFDLQSCEVVDSVPKAALNVGFYVESLALYSNVTGNFTASTNQAYLDSVVSSTVTSGAWSGPDGVINVGQKAIEHADWKSLLLHGLYEYIAKNTQPASQSLIVSQWIAVQFNAVQKQASSMKPEGTIYGTGWAGPSPSTFNPAGQLAAGMLFNVALGLSDGNTSASSGSFPGSPTYMSTPSSSSETTSHSSKRTGAIVGGVIGCLVGISLILGAIVFVRRRRARAQDLYFPRPLKPSRDRESGIDPFITPAPSPDAPPAIRRALVADGTRITKVQRERYAPGASDVFSTSVPPYSYDPHADHAEPTQVDPEALQRILTAFHNITARMNRRERYRDEMRQYKDRYLNEDRKPPFEERKDPL